MKEGSMSHDSHKIICNFEWNSQKSVVFTHHLIPVKGSQVHSTHQRWFWLLPMDSIIFPSEGCMEAPLLGSPSSHLTKSSMFLVMVQSLSALWVCFRWCIAIIFIGDHETKLIPSYITSSQRWSTGKWRQELILSSWHSNSFCQQTQDKWGKWRQDVNHRFCFPGC